MAADFEAIYFLLSIQKASSRATGTCLCTLCWSVVVILQLQRPLKAMTFDSDFRSQDSNYPWKRRVSFAKDIAAGMVSSMTENECNNNNVKKIEMQQERKVHCFVLSSLLSPPAGCVSELHTQYISY